MLIQRRIDIMTEMGIEFRCNVEIGKDIALSKLKAEFEAVVLAVGATKARNLEVPGNDANGVVLAVDPADLLVNVLSQLDILRSPHYF